MKLREHNITLQGERLALRPMTEDDWGILLKWNCDPEVLYYTEGGDVTSWSLEEIQGIYRGVSQNAFCFMIEVGGIPIGECWLQRMNLDRILEKYPNDDCRRIDLMIGEKSLWGLGLGTEAIRLLTDLAFEREKADLVFGCEVADYNPASQKAFMKNGYEIDTVITQPPGDKAKECFDLKKINPSYSRHRRSIRREKLSLRDELLSMKEEDLRMRAELAAEGSLFDGYHPRMEEVHRRNAARLRQIIDEHGWPGKILVGENGAQAAWLIAQHAIGEPDFQRFCLRLLKAAADAGEVDAWQPAYLEDRIRVFEGRPQIYATQFDIGDDGLPIPHEIEEPENVDERRRAVGLEPLTDQLGRAERVDPPTPETRTKRDREYREWLRKAGWRE